MKRDALFLLVGWVSGMFVLGMLGFFALLLSGHESMIAGWAATVLIVAFIVSLIITAA